MALRNDLHEARGATVDRGLSGAVMAGVKPLERGAARVMGASHQATSRSLREVSKWPHRDKVIQEAHICAVSAYDSQGTLIGR